MREGRRAGGADAEPRLERLHKILATAGIASRRAAERLIDQGRVRVNGEVVNRQGLQVDPRSDVIAVDGKKLAAAPAERTYLLLHKPRGFVTTLADPQGRPTVLDLVRGIGRRVFPVGRLDLDSEGLLLLTDDGALARDLMHPARRVPRTYAVQVRGEPDAQDIRRLERGVTLDGRRTLPAKIESTAGNKWLQVTLFEGRNRQVRRMFQALGHTVVRLKRTSYGGVELGRLPGGGLRALSPAEVSRLKSYSAKVAPSKPAPRTRTSR